MSTPAKRIRSGAAVSFQARILNFNEKMISFHNIDMTSIIRQNFLALSVSMKAMDETEIIAKYPEEIANKILDMKNKIDELSITNNSAKFAIHIEHRHFITKNKDQATSVDCQAKLTHLSTRQSRLLRRVNSICQ